MRHGRAPDCEVMRALPCRLAECSGEGRATAAGGLRVRLRHLAQEPLCGRDSVEIDRWILTPAIGSAVVDWFGSDMERDRRWLLLALDRDLADIDSLIAAQVNAVLHTPAFQGLEARWRGLDFLTDVAGQAPLAKIRMLSATWSDVSRDLDRGGDFDRSQLFSKIYSEELGTLGGEPFGLLVGDYEVQHRPSADHPDDIAALKALALIGAAAFAPIVLGTSPHLFQLETFGAMGRPFDLKAVFRHADYRRWMAMREGEEMRFLGLVLPRILMRPPHSREIARRDGFRFAETVDSPDSSDYLWGNGAFAFASVVLRAYANFGWFADIRGAARDELRGGVVVNLPVTAFATDAPGVATKPSMEALLSDTQEKDLADLGFIALRKIPFSDYSVFYSNQSLQSLPRLDRPVADVNARLSAMLQYMLCVSRFAHYVKLMGRAFIGTMKTADEVQEALQTWLLNYCLGSDEATQDAKARYPLREASVQIKSVPGESGAFSCVLFLRPHFQLDDVATGFRLTTRLAPARAA